MASNVPKATEMKCVICKTGDLREGRTNVTVERDGRVVLIKDAPAEICDSCDEYYLDDAVAQRVYELVDGTLARGREFTAVAFPVGAPA